MITAYDLSRISIVCAEPHDLMRRAMQGIFRCFNIQHVHMTKTPEDTLTAIRNVGPDVVFLDWSLSFDGVAVLEQIRRGADSPNPFLPVVMVSSYTGKNQIVKARDAGIHEFIAKPVSPQLVYIRIRAVIEASRRFIRTSQYFGPDRRRRFVDFDGPDRRSQANAA